MTTKEFLDLPDPLKRDERPHKKGTGWAPGLYANRCQICKKPFTGDKYASTCAPCAYKDHE